MVSFNDGGDLIFRALADKSRRELLDRIHGRAGQSLNELCQGLAMTRPAVAKHLRILEEANLVSFQRRGREKLHYLNPVPINDIAERWIGKFERPRLRALSDLKESLEVAPAKEVFAGANKVERKPTMAESRFHYVTYIRAAPDKVWEALTSAEMMKSYFFGLRFEAELKTGGSWRRLSPDGALMTEGEILEFNPPSRLVMSWRNAEPEKKAEGFSRCVMDLAPAGAATKLTVTQSIGVENSKLIEAVAQAWPEVMSNLTSYLESGEVTLTIPSR